jgi:hypothetical protein
MVWLMQAAVDLVALVQRKVWHDQLHADALWLLPHVRMFAAA